MAGKELLTVEEAAERLGMSPESIRRLCRQEKLPSDMIGGQWVIYAELIPTTLRTRRRRAPQVPPVNLNKAFEQIFRKDVKELWVPDPVRMEDYRAAKTEVVEEASRRFATPGPFQLPTWVDIPKTPFLARPGYMLTLEDRVAYHAAIATFAPAVEESLRQVDSAAGQQTVYGNRLGNDDRFLLQHWKGQWLAFRAAVDDYVDAGYEYMLKTDIVGYYEAIQHPRLFQYVVNHNAEQPVVKALRVMLATWTPSRDIGIPQGPDASSVLGNLYLLPVDQEMVEAPGIYFRFMDDIRIMARSRRELAVAARQLQIACRRQGLSLAAAKTKMLVGDEAKRDLRDDGDMDKVRYFFDDPGRHPHIALPILKRILRKALARDGAVDDKAARFSLWRLARVRDRSVLNKVLKNLEELAPVARYAAQFIQRFIRRESVQGKLADYFQDRDRNLSPFLSTWLMAACLDHPWAMPAEWIRYARNVFTNKNAPPFQRAIAASLVARGRQQADLDLLKDALRQEHDPAMARALLVALARGGSLDRAVADEAVKRMPGLAITVQYLRGRRSLPSLVYPGETSRLPT